ncbi:nucleotidyltransferase family protein [Acidiferrobacter sp.]|uniref:nucleotidyltransferase family protein n=1 Tax=Acidiferrobacter sp. TaxID=1872107 RepID=UPI0026240BF2|nr:nucleotidyltransferase family protein [Acidiferrobacter sp.]
MITGLLLAAGRSRRYGSPKLVESMDGVAPAVRSAHALRAAVDRAVAIIRPDDLALASQLRGAGFEIICCPDAHGGQGASLALGVRMTGGSTGWLVASADMPYIKPETAQAVAAQLRLGAIIVAPYFHGRRGHPVGFARALGPQLGAITGDTGALALIKAHRHLVVKIPCSDSGILGDIDAPEDLLHVTANRDSRFADGARH